MKIPRELIEQILERHKQGKTDTAIAHWLSTLTPPVDVQEDAVRKIRRRACAVPIQPDKAPDKLPAVEPIKPAGNANRRARRERDDLEGKQQEERGGGSFIKVPECADRLSAFTHQVEVLKAWQQKVNDDPEMALDAKIRHSVSISLALGKIQSQAELEREFESHKAEHQAKIDELDTYKAELERDAKIARKCESCGHEGGPT